MSKGQTTKARIIAQAAPLFNQRGYAGTAITDIMSATGLNKGGIYNHFSSKDDLALQAFDYAFHLTNVYFSEHMRGYASPLDKLSAFITAFRGVANGQPLVGGCPILNTAIEADDTHPNLRAKAQQAMDQWRSFLGQLLSRALEIGELRADLDIEATIVIIIALLEGGIMMSKLYGDSQYIQTAVDYLLNQIEGQWRAV